MKDSRARTNGRCSGGDAIGRILDKLMFMDGEKRQKMFYSNQCKRNVSIWQISSFFNVMPSCALIC